MAEIVSSRNGAGELQFANLSPSKIEDKCKNDPRMNNLNVLCGKEKELKPITIVGELLNLDGTPLKNITINSRNECLIPLTGLIGEVDSRKLKYYFRGRNGGDVFVNGIVSDSDGNQYLKVIYAPKNSEVDHIVIDGLVTVDGKSSYNVDIDLNISI